MYKSVHLDEDAVSVISNQSVLSANFTATLNDSHGLERIFLFITIIITLQYMGNKQSIFSFHSREELFDNVVSRAEHFSYNDR